MKNKNLSIVDHVFSWSVHCSRHHHHPQSNRNRGITQLTAEAHRRSFRNCPRRGRTFDKPNGGTWNWFKKRYCLQISHVSAICKRIVFVVVYQKHIKNYDAAVLLDRFCWNGPRTLGFKWNEKNQAEGKFAKVEHKVRLWPLPV